MNNNNNIIPMMTYSASRDKSIIYKENKNKFGIYRLNNLITGKSYIGSSKCLASRLSVYYSKQAMFNKLSTRRSIIYKALLKHGYNNFSVDILEFCEIDVLVEREQYYLNTLKSEYNILKIANSRLGSKQSEATKIKISMSNKDKHLHFLGKTHTHESRQMISLKFTARNNNIPRIIKLKTRLKLSLRSHGVPIKVFNKSNKFFFNFLLSPVQQNILI